MNEYKRKLPGVTVIRRMTTPPHHLSHLPALPALTLEFDPGGSLGTLTPEVEQAIIEELGAMQAEGRRILEAHWAAEREPTN
jgi:hypothetical protein